MEAKQELDSQMAPPTELAAHPEGPTAATEVPSSSVKDQQPPPSLSPEAPSTPDPAAAVNKISNVSDTVDAPVGPSLAAQEVPMKKEESQTAPADKGPEKEEIKMEEVKKLDEEEQVVSPKSEPAVEVAVAATPVSMANEETATKTTEASQPPPTIQKAASPQTQSADQRSAPEPEPTLVDRTEEPLLSNGLPQEPEELSEDMAFSDTTPHDKPDTSQTQESTPVAKTATPAQEEEEKKKGEELMKKSEDAPPASASCPEESPMQGTKMNLSCIYIATCFHIKFYVRV